MVAGGAKVYDKHMVIMENNDTAWSAYVGDSPFLAAHSPTPSLASAPPCSADAFPQLMLTCNVRVLPGDVNSKPLNTEATQITQHEHQSQLYVKEDKSRYINSHFLITDMGAQGLLVSHVQATCS
jgi:hypothetical protein